MKHWILCGIAPTLFAGTLVTTGEIVERDGLARRSTLLEQGIPIAPLPAAEARKLVLRRADGHPIAAVVEPEARDEHGNVRWVRVSAMTALPASGRLPVRIELEEGTVRPALAIRLEGGSIVVDHSHYRLTLRKPDEVELSVNGKTILSGKWGVDLVGVGRPVGDVGVPDRVARGHSLDCLRTVGNLRSRPAGPVLRGMAA